MDFTLFQTIVHIVGLLVFHYIGDHLLQTGKMGLEKHKDNIILIYHVAIYTVVMTLFANYIFWDFPSDRIVTFFLVTFISHFITDYITSRINHQLYERKETKKLLNMIYLDQNLHYFQLIITYYFLVK